MFVLFSPLATPAPCIPVWPTFLGGSLLCIWMPQLLFCPLVQTQGHSGHPEYSGKLHCQLGSGSSKSEPFSEESADQQMPLADLGVGPFICSPSDVIPACLVGKWGGRLRRKGPLSCGHLEPNPVGSPGNKCRHTAPSTFI